MNPLLGNQIRKELRQHAALLAVILGVLALEVVRSVGETAFVFDEDGNYVLRGGSAAPMMLAFAALGLAVAIGIGLLDSPSNSSGFIRTRPVPGRTVWLAKMLVLTFCVALPAALVPFSVCVFEGAGFAHALHAAFDRFAFVFPVVVFSACWSGLCGTRSRLAGYTLAGAALLIAVFLLAFGGVALLGDEFALFNEPGSMVARFLLLFWMAAGLAAIALARQLRGPRRKRPLVLAAFVAVVIACAFSIPALNFLAPDAEISGADAHSLDGLRVAPDRYGIRVPVRSGSERGGSQPKLSVETPFRVEGAPKGTVFTPRHVRLRLVGDDGFDEPATGASRMGWKLGSVPTTPEIVHAISALMERDLSVYSEDSHLQFAATRKITNHWAEGKVPAERQRAPLDIVAELDLVGVEAKRIAAFPFRDGATATVDGVPMTLVLPPVPASDTPLFALRTRLRQSILTRNETRRIGNAWDLRSRFVALLVHPERDEALFLALDSGRTAKGELSGFPERIMIFGRSYHSSRKSLFKQEFYEKCAIQLFQLRWLGEHTASARIADVRLEDRRVLVSSGRARRLDSAALGRALEELGEIPDEPDRDDAMAVLQLVDRSENDHSDPADPTYRRLVRIGRRDIEALLDAVGTSGGGSQRVLLAAVGALASERTKGRILAHLAPYPQLAEIVLAHGWEEDAREQLLQPLRARRPLPRSALQAIALLGHEDTRPLLLEQFARKPDRTTYDMLRAIPGLRPDLDRIIRKNWENYRRYFAIGARVGEPEAALALLIGDENALTLILAGLEHDLHSTVQSLRRVMLLSQNERRAAESLADATAADFEFDEDRRLFQRRTREDDPS